MIWNFGGSFRLMCLTESVPNLRSKTVWPMSEWIPNQSHQFLLGFVWKMWKILKLDMGDEHNQQTPVHPVTLYPLTHIHTTIAINCKLLSSSSWFTLTQKGWMLEYTDTCIPSSNHWKLPIQRSAGTSRVDQGPISLGSKQLPRRWWVSSYGMLQKHGKIWQNVACGCSYRRCVCVYIYIYHYISISLHVHTHNVYICLTMNKYIFIHLFIVLLQGCLLVMRIDS